MVLLLLVSFFLRVLWLDHPTDPQGHADQIFDERYYLSAARTIMGLPQADDAPYVHSPIGKDPNREHPPLAKLIIASGIAMLGDDGWGWRWGSVAAGMLAIAFMYQMGRRTGLGPWAGVLAAFLFAFDNLVFVTSRIGILDIFMLLGMLAGAAWFLMRQPALSGVAFAFGTLCKEYGVYGPVVMICYIVIYALYQRRHGRQLRHDVVNTLSMVGAYLVCFFGVLWLLDLHWSTFTNPIMHLEYVWSYGTKLTHPYGPTGIESWPWEWLRNEVQIPYLRVDVTVCQIKVSVCPADQIARKYASILFRGAMNAYLIFTAPLAGGYVLAVLHKQFDRTALLAGVWFAVTYLPFVPATVLDHRIAYIYYMLPVIPAITVASAQLFADPRIPRAVTWGYIVAIGWGFAAYFPFAGFTF